MPARPTARPDALLADRAARGDRLRARGRPARRASACRLPPARPARRRRDVRRAAASPPATTPPRRRAAASDLPAALEAALAALVSRDVKTSPVGAGDWRAAREAIRAFYAARDFAPVWVDATGPDARRRMRRCPASPDRKRTASIFPPSPCRRARRRPLARAARRGRSRCISAAVVAYAMQASGARLVPTRISPLISARPSVADPGRAWRRSPPPSIPAPRSRISIRSKKAISICATN